MDYYAVIQILEWLMCEPQGSDLSDIVSEYGDSAKEAGHQTAFEVQNLATQVFCISLFYS